MHVICSFVVGHKIAQQLDGKVKRKVIKQTVMTIVYGVTFVGGRLQIERQLKDLDIDERILFDSSAYLVHKVFASIGQLFTRAKAIQVLYSLEISNRPVRAQLPCALHVANKKNRAQKKRVGQLNLRAKNTYRIHSRTLLYDVIKIARRGERFDS